MINLKRVTKDKNKNIKEQQLEFEYRQMLQDWHIKKGPDNDKNVSESNGQIKSAIE